MLGEKEGRPKGSNRFGAFVRTTAAFESSASPSHPFRYVVGNQMPCGSARKRSQVDNFKLLPDGGEFCCWMDDEGMNQVLVALPLRLCSDTDHDWGFIRQTEGRWSEERLSQCYSLDSEHLLCYRQPPFWHRGGSHEEWHLRFFFHQRNLRPQINWNTNKLKGCCCINALILFNIVIIISIYHQYNTRAFLHVYM